MSISRKFSILLMLYATQILSMAGDSPDQLNAGSVQSLTADLSAAFELSAIPRPELPGLTAISDAGSIIDGSQSIGEELVSPSRSVRSVTFGTGNHNEENESNAGVEVETQEIPAVHEIRRKGVNWNTLLQNPGLVEGRTCKVEELPSSASSDGSADVYEKIEKIMEDLKIKPEAQNDFRNAVLGAVFGYNPVIFIESDPEGTGTMVLSNDRYPKNQNGLTPILVFTSPIESKDPVNQPKDLVVLISGQGRFSLNLHKFCDSETGGTGRLVSTLALFKYLAGRDLAGLDVDSFLSDPGTRITFVPREGAVFQNSKQRYGTFTVYNDSAAQITDSNKLKGVNQMRDAQSVRYYINNGSVYKVDVKKGVETNPTLVLESLPHMRTTILGVDQIDELSGKLTVFQAFAAIANAKNSSTNAVIPYGNPATPKYMVITKDVLASELNKVVLVDPYLDPENQSEYTEHYASLTASDLTNIVSTIVPKHRKIRAAADPLVVADPRVVRNPSQASLTDSEPSV